MRQQTSAGMHSYVSLPRSSPGPRPSGWCDFESKAFFTPPFQSLTVPQQHRAHEIIYPPCDSQSGFSPYSVCVGCTDESHLLFSSRHSSTLAVIKRLVHLSAVWVFFCLLLSLYQPHCSLRTKHIQQGWRMPNMPKLAIQCAVYKINYGENCFKRRNCQQSSEGTGLCRFPFSRASAPYLASPLNAMR